MNTNNIFVADPFNEKHIKLFDEFENINNKLKKPVTTYLTGIRKAYCDKNSFYNIQKDSNEINVIAFMQKEHKMQDYCYIKCEKDRKVCELFFAHLKSPKQVRPIMQKISDYVLNTMGMELISISISDDEKYLYSQLKNYGFEDIGEVNGKLTLIKEKEDIYEMSKVI